MSESNEGKSVDDLKAEHGEVCVVNSRGGQMVFKPPPSAEYERFQDAIGNTGKKGSSIGPASRNLCLACVLIPSKDEARAIFAKQPALPLKVADILADMAGADADVEIQKV